MSSWVRLWHDMPTDPKWRVIARRSGASLSEVIAIFTFVLVNASANATERGRTHNLFADDIAAALDMDEATVEAVLAAMEGKVLSNGALIAWERRQPKREDNSADRARQWRDEKKAERMRTQANAAERPETDTETDAEIIEEPKGSRASRDAPAGALTPEQIVSAWNDLAERTGLATVRSLTKGRRQQIAARLKDYPNIDEWADALAAIERSPFLLGLEGRSGWRANFDFLLQPSSFAKLIEGTYDRKPAD